uniref:G-protein coupled receptors family 1 profile domain-containing protein n=1 Tax=Clytia hemisphaerica TaxID=252671 RepID=A0A7M5V649_9CNID
MNSTITTPYTFQSSTVNKTTTYTVQPNTNPPSTTPYTSMVNTTTMNGLSTTEESEHGVIDLPLGASLLVINICIIVLNVFIIAVIVRFRTKNAIDVFVLALATTDLIKGLIPVPMSVYIYLTEWYLIEGSYACDFFGWIAFTTNSGSMLLLTLMSIERFVAIAHPFAYKAWVRPNKILAIILTAEVFTGIHSALPLLGVGRILPYNGGAYSHFDYSRYDYGTMAYSVFIICYGFSMILVVMVAYSFVFHKIRDLIHRHKRMTNARSDGSVRRDKSIRQLNLKTETMFSYLTVALMVLFWFSWLPFLMVVVASQIGAKQPHGKLDLFAIRIAVVNSMLNPIACAALCKPYRNGIMYYFRVFLSYFGFKKPDDNVWDPWKKNTRRHHTRRHKPSVVDFNERDFARSEIFASSYDDSGLAAQGIYRKQSKDRESLSTLSSQGSETSDLEDGRRSKSSSRKNSKYRKKSSVREGPDANKLVNGTPTPLQRRKKIFVEKVQKYIHQKKERKHSFDLLDEKPVRKTISAGDLLDPDYIQMQERHREKRKVKSFQVKLKKNEDYESSGNEAEENDRLLVAVHPRRERASTLGEMDELVTTLSNKHPSWKNLNQQEDIETPDVNDQHCSDDKGHHQDKVLLPRQPFVANGSAYTIIDGPEEERLKGYSTQKSEEERRCVSEAFSDDTTIPLDNMAAKASKNGKVATHTSAHSLKMIDHVTKELVEFSQNSLNNSASNQPIT